MAEGLCGEPLEKKNPHQGHRERLKKRFLAESLSSFEDHNALELLLFYVLPRRDTNPIAHDLVGRFGSLERVLEASKEELAQVDYLSESGIALLKLVHQVGLRYADSLTSSLKGKVFEYKETGEYLVRRFAFRREEEVYAIFYDKGMVYLGECVLHKGCVNSASFGLRKVADALSQYGASYLSLAHNHPGGVPIASSDDLNVSHQLKEFLAQIRVTLLEHYVVAGEHYTGTEHRAKQKEEEEEQE